MKIIKNITFWHAAGIFSLSALSDFNFFYFCPCWVFSFITEMQMYFLYFWLILGDKEFRTYHIQNHQCLLSHSFYCWFSVFQDSAWLILFQGFGLSVWITITSPGNTHFAPVRFICFFQQSSEVDKAVIINLKYLLEMLRYWKFL